MITSIQPQILNEQLKAGQELLLLDVREKAELSGEFGHVERMVHIPLGELESRLAELQANKEKTVVTICKMGGRASQAADILEQAGFKSVLVMEGGMKSWSELGLPVSKTVG